MINEELYHKTCDILVAAYFEDKLTHGSCTACAVGNIISFYRPFPKKEAELLSVSTEERKGWSAVFCTFSDNGRITGQLINEDAYDHIAEAQIKPTGYDWKNLAKIEYAFESASEGMCEDEYMFNGLMAVIDVLDQIHQNTNQATTEAAKRKFSPSVL